MKDFSKTNANCVYEYIENATAEPDETQEAQEQAQEQEQPAAVKHPRKTYSEEAAQEMRAAGTTQGRKGCKAVRINMAFSPDVHDYIKKMARARGLTFTEFTNDVFRRSMERNADIYNDLKDNTDNFE